MWHNEIDALENENVPAIRLCRDTPGFFNLQPGTWADASPPDSKHYIANEGNGQNASEAFSFGQRFAELDGCAYKYLYELPSREAMMP